MTLREKAEKAACEINVCGQPFAPECGSAECLEVRALIAAIIEREAISFAEKSLREALAVCVVRGGGAPEGEPLVSAEFDVTPRIGLVDDRTDREAATELLEEIVREAIAAAAKGGA